MVSSFDSGPFHCSRGRVAVHHAFAAPALSLGPRHGHWGRATGKDGMARRRPVCPRPVCRSRVGLRGEESVAEGSRRLPALGQAGEAPVATDGRRGGRRLVKRPPRLAFRAERARGASRRCRCGRLLVARHRLQPVTRARAPPAQARRPASPSTRDSSSATAAAAAAVAAVAMAPARLGNRGAAAAEGGRGLVGARAGGRRSTPPPPGSRRGLPHPAPSGLERTGPAPRGRPDVAGSGSGAAWPPPLRATPAPPAQPRPATPAADVRGPGLRRPRSSLPAPPMPHPYAAPRPDVPAPGASGTFGPEAPALSPRSMPPRGPCETRASPVPGARTRGPFRVSKKTPATVSWRRPRSRKLFTRLGSHLCALRTPFFF